MSNDTFYWGGDSRQMAASNLATQLYAWTGNSGDLSYGTESQGQFKAGAACTLDKGRVLCTARTGTITGSFGPRMNGVNGNVVMAVNATGEFEDTTHSDSLSAGALTIWRATGNSNGDSATIIGPYGVHVQGGSGETYTSQVQGSGSWGHAGTANAFVPLMGRIGGLDSSTEAPVQIKQRAAGTHSQLRVVASANSIPATTVVTFRKSGVSGAQTVTFVASTPGILDDTTHSDTVANGDLSCVLYSSGSATGSMTILSQCETFAPSAHLWDVLNYTVGTNTSNTIVTFVGPVGLPNANATESQFQMRLRWASRVANLRGQWINNFSTTGALVSRINGVTGNCTVTPTASTSGYFEDTTHHDDLATGNLFCWQQGITTSIGWQEHIQATWGLAANNAAIGTVFGQFSQAFAGVNLDAAAISTVFGRFSQAFAATDLPRERGDITTTFGLFGQAVNASDLSVGGSGVRQFWTF